MIRYITNLLNDKELGYIADVGYPGEDIEGIFLIDTNSKGSSLHTHEDSIQILIQVSELVDPYLKAKDLARSITSILEAETEAYQVTSRYVGTKSDKQIFSINLKIGGVK